MSRRACVYGGRERGADAGLGAGGELAGLPEGDEGFQAGEDALEAGVDQQVQSGQQCPFQGEAIGLFLECGADDGQLLGQGGFF